MSEEKQPNRLTRLEKDNPGMFGEMYRTVRLVLRLLADRRVNFFLKLLPIGALVYLISPLDAAIPVIDDMAIIGIGTYMFLELCPPDVVEEHRARLAGLEETGQESQSKGQVVDSEFNQDKPE